jgi:hypothetical protein
MRGKAIAERSRRVRDNNEKQCRNSENNTGTPVASVLPWRTKKPGAVSRPGVMRIFAIVGNLYKIR